MEIEKIREEFGNTVITKRGKLKVANGNTEK